MPSNKNALTRIMFLDELLSDRHHHYDIHELTDKCNKKLIEAGLPEVTQRCIEKDIQYLEYDPFFAEIERFRIKGKRCLTYSNPSYSIFKKEMTREERHLLSEVLSTIGQFDGLVHFEWLEHLKQSLNIEEQRKIISFSNNPYLQNSNLLGILFDYISNRVVISLDYHTFTDKTVKTLMLHPYLLKEYNNRWFLLGAADTDKQILTMALDRIDNVKPCIDREYSDCPQDLSERFEDIIGVTLFKDQTVEHILLWASDYSQDYIITKPIHESQIIYHGEEEQSLRQEYEVLEGGSFFSIDCIPNYELIRELCSYGKDVIVLSPRQIQNEINDRILQMSQVYSEVRK